MAAESKPMFYPEVIRRRLRNFVLPESVADSRPSLQHWANLISSGQADKLKETDLLPDFLNDVFCTLLGYTRPAGSPDCRGTRGVKHAHPPKTHHALVVSRKPCLAETFRAFLAGIQDFEPDDPESEALHQILEERHRRVAQHREAILKPKKPWWKLW